MKGEQLRYSVEDGRVYWVGSEQRLNGVKGRGKRVVVNEAVVAIGSVNGRGKAVNSRQSEVEEYL